MECTASEFLDRVRQKQPISDASYARHVNTARNMIGRLAIHEAVLSKDLDLVRSLVEKGADVNLKAGVGKTAVHLAVEAETFCLGIVSQQTLSIIEYLMDLESADFSAKGVRFSSVIDSLVQHHKPELVIQALKRCAYEDDDGALLSRIIHRNNAEILHAARTSLIPCDFNRSLPFGASQLMTAAAAGLWKSVEYMVLHTDADVTATREYCGLIETPTNNPCAHGSHPASNTYSILDMIVGRPVPDACIYELIRRGARLYNVISLEYLIRSFEGFKPRPGSRDPVKLVISVIRTMTPCDGVLCRLQHMTISYFAHFHTLGRLLEVCISYLSNENGARIRLDGSDESEVVHDQLLRGMYFADTPSPSFLEVPVVRVGLKPWTPLLHSYVFSRSYRSLVHMVCLAWYMTSIDIPCEIWYIIISFFPRSWFSREDPPSVSGPTAGDPCMIEWRASLE
jgi:hypothetical protein